MACCWWMAAPWRLIDLRSGQERWRLATGLGSLAHPVVVKDAALVHGGDGTVLGVGSDGRERWRVATDAVWQERSMATGLMHSAKEVPQPAVLPDGVVLTLPTTLDEPSIDRKGQPAAGEETCGAVDLPGCGQRCRAVAPHRTGLWSGSDHPAPAP